MVLTVTGGGGLCLLLGLLLLGHIVGSYDLDTVLAAGERVRSHDLYLPALFLIFLGALTKSAQFPFHFWLPQSMAALSFMLILEGLSAVHLAKIGRAHV